MTDISHSPSLCHTTRRNVILSLLGLGVTSTCSHPLGDALALANTSLDPDVPWTRVRSIVELTGEIHLRDENAVMKGARKSTSVESTSTVDYEEQVSPTAAKGDGLAAVLRILEAKIENRINKVAIVDEIRPECRQLIRVINQNELLTNSIEEPLTAQERDLVDGVIATTFLDELIPLKSIQIGQSWQPTKETIAKLFHLDAVHNSTLKLRLLDTDSEKGQIDLQGKVDAAANGVATSFNVEGKAQVDRKRGLITWFAIKMDETREIGEAEPGYKVSARIRILRAPLDAPTSTENLNTIPNDFVQSEQPKFLRIASRQGGFQLFALDKWRVMKDSPSLMLLRYVDRNTSLCQCNVINLPDFEAGRQMSLEGFQSEVQRALGTQFQQSLEATEKVTENGLRWLRCISAGESNGVPVYWSHNLVSDDSGRRTNITLTMDRSSAEILSAQDEQLISSFRFKERPTTSILEAASAASQPSTNTKIPEVGSKKPAPAIR